MTIRDAICKSIGAQLHYIIIQYINTSLRLVQCPDKNHNHCGAILKKKSPQWKREEKFCELLFVDK